MWEICGSASLGYEHKIFQSPSAIRHPPPTIKLRLTILQFHTLLFETNLTIIRILSLHTCSRWLFQCDASPAVRWLGTNGRRTWAYCKPISPKGEFRCFERHLHMHIAPSSSWIYSFSHLPMTYDSTNLLPVMLWMSSALSDTAADEWFWHTLTWLRSSWITTRKVQKFQRHSQVSGWHPELRFAGSEAWF